MFEVKLLIDLAKVSTSFEVKRSKQKQIVLQEEKVLPIVYVGYGTIDSENPTLAQREPIINQFGQDLVQDFDVQIVCMEEDLPRIWNKLYQNIVGKNLQPLESQSTGFSYKQGGVLGLDNGRIWHLDRWSLAFPTMNTFTI